MKTRMKNLQLTDKELDVLFSLVSVKKGKLSRPLKLSEGELKLKDELEVLSSKIWDLSITD